MVTQGERKGSPAKGTSWPSNENVCTRSARGQIFFGGTVRCATVENVKAAIEHVAGIYRPAHLGHLVVKWYTPRWSMYTLSSRSRRTKHMLYGLLQFSSGDRLREITINPCR